jgi:hypothetical protein
MRRSLATCIASLVLLAACSEDEPAPERKTSDAVFKPVISQAKAEAGATFVDVTRAAGIDFVHVNGATPHKYLPETMGSGVAMLDHDGDGDLDLLFVQSCYWEADAQPTLKLYRNDGAGKFTDVTIDSGLGFSCYGMGATVADYDADGDPDVYLTALGRDTLLRNDGGRFTRVKDGPDGGKWSDDEGEHYSWSTAAAWFDADRDGDLDLIVVPYVRWTIATDVRVTQTGDEKAYTRPQLYEGDNPRLYLQEDDGSFRDATEGSGFDATAVKGKSMAVCVDDFNGDGLPDVFVANDTVQNFLFLAQGGGKFKESAVPAAIGYDDRGRARAAMGVDAVDYRNDGRVAIGIGNFSEEPVSLYTVARAGEGGVLFKDDASTARIGTATLLPLTFGLVMADVDLDGWCDLVLSNGHIEPSVTKLKSELLYAQTPQYLRNLQGRRFVDVSRDAGAPFQERIVGRGLAAGDLDDDGDLDLVFTSNGGRPLVLRNDLATSNKSLRVKLRQPGTKNLDALGAVVRVTAGGMTQRRVVRTGSSYLSQGELTLTFGVGEAKEAEVEVTWPDGETQDAGTLEAGQTHTITRAK